jgi:copper homeostasis protein
MAMYTFEVCTTNLQSVLNASIVGAHRVELCAAIDVGGVTPSMGLIEAAVALQAIRICVLIRPREGDFFYHAQDVRIMLRDIEYCREAGAAGVVIGAADQHQRLDRSILREMSDAAGDMEVVSHRVFDFVPDPFEALDTLIDLGFDRVLTSGGASTAWEGRERLRELVTYAGDAITIMPGSGIHADHLGALATHTGATHFHFTGRVKRPGTASAEIKGLEAGYWESDPDVLRQIMASVKPR